MRTASPLQTANDAFKDRYRASLRAALGAAVVIHLLAFILVPALSVTPYQLPPEPEGPRLVDVPDAPAHVPLLDDVPLPPRPGPTPVEAPEADPDLRAPDPDPVPPNDLEPPGLAAPDPVRMPFFVVEQEPVPIELVPPVYPRLAREAGMEGRVVVRVLVDDTGRVAQAVVVQVDGTEAMAEAARRAALRCRFEPARQRDVPVPAFVTIPFTFKLH